MATRTDTSTTSTSTPTSSNSSVEPSSGGTSLANTEGGMTTIDQAVVSKIASIAVREVEGVYRLGGAISGAVASVVSRIRGGDEHSTAGVGVEVGTRQAAVDIIMIAEYPVPLQELTNSVRDNVTSRIESLTGLEVVEVNIVVTDLYFPGDEDESQAQPKRVE